MDETDLRELLVMFKRLEDRLHEVTVQADQFRVVLDAHHDDLLEQQRQRSRARHLVPARVAHQHLKDEWPDGAA